MRTQPHIPILTDYASAWTNTERRQRGNENSLVALVFAIWIAAVVVDTLWTAMLTFGQH